MKNLLLIHLESLNYQHYMLNKEKWFPNLSAIEKECISFHNYYSTATSTLMTIGDLIYGSTDQYETSTTLDDVPSDYKIKTSMLDDLKNNGYETGIYVYPTGNNLKEANERHLAGMNNKIDIIHNYNEYITQCKEVMASENFALYACNYISNLVLCFNMDLVDKEIDKTYWQLGFEDLDKCCGELWDYLKNTDKLGNTIVVFYGDHGDDYYRTETHECFTHSIDPNNLLVHTPLMIYSPEKINVSKEIMIQTTDLREIIMKLLLEDSDVIPSSRTYCFSRNAYACQPIREGGFDKGYSCTDGEFMLCVTHRGLTMYHTGIDDSCQHNLLKYFLIKENILIFYNDANFVKRNIKLILNHRNQRIFRRKFYELKDVLYSWVCEMYAAGNRTEEEMNQEMNFNQINYN